MKSKRYLALATALAASGAMLAPAFPHESRVLPASTGSIRLSVGFNVEPAFEDSYNGLDLFLFTFDGRCPIDKTDFFGNAITSAEVTSVHAEALYLDKSAPPTGTLGSLPPTAATILKKQEISIKSPVKGVFGDPGHYKSFFRPTHASTDNNRGAYGFHVWGTVSTQETSYTCDADSDTPTTQIIPARTAPFDNYWICGAALEGGTTEERGSFGCISPVQAFPGSAKDGYQPNGGGPGT